MANIRQNQEKRYDEDALVLTSKLLSENPEFYTVWNHRRRILIAQIDKIKDSDPGAAESASENVREKQITKLLAGDLRFLVPLLQKFPKCYWLWNHRSWLLKQTEKDLPIQAAIEFWTQEMGLVTKMLGRDSRNFHAWGYRRGVVAELERLEESLGRPSSKTTEEVEYTRQMIGKNLSNFSAWHARSKLLLRLADEKGLGAAERKKIFDEGDIHLSLFSPSLYQSNF